MHIKLESLQTPNCQAGLLAVFGFLAVSLWQGRHWALEEGDGRKRKRKGYSHLCQD
jgi:hypothetical protein